MDEKKQLEGIRLQLYLSRSGIGSRRRCEEYISGGRAAVNGKIVTELGSKVYPGDAVSFDGRPVTPELKKRYLAVHKPPGYLCANSDRFGRPLVKELFQNEISERLFHVGRLDLHSGGLVFYTNDGNFSAMISHPSSEIEKEYLVRTDKPVPDSLLDNFCSGIEVGGTVYRLKSYRKISEKKVILILVEGKNREIRRVFESAGLGIQELKRKRIGTVVLGGLAEGEYRELNRDEIDSLTAQGESHGSSD